MTEFFESLIEPTEPSKRKIAENTSTKRLSSAHLDKQNDPTMNQLINTMLHLEESDENYTISETLRKYMLDVFIKFLDENKGSMDMTYSAERFLLREDKKDSEAEVKTLL